MGRIGRVLADFRGSWRLERDILHADGSTARFEGAAQWLPVGNVLIYHEAGQMQMPGHALMQAERRYEWREDLSVWFDDGRFFHHVPAQGGESEHWCDPDRYRVQYDFSDWPVFSTTWQVTGPRKGYKMISRYRRDPT